ncbi:glycoside hydrolase family 13 protein [Amanita thiersii Skay4041]|uniref:alpha-amylase n=1 Tax=Amanita thiersii Skay4041 TaxID=703135 RepID=A0A2A9ND03_9AGAR|nr:glycoside hydrolase family 13 protein [Amanita thiersii Skay4041]
MLLYHSRTVTLIPLLLLFGIPALKQVSGATFEEWRGRSIYQQVVTDRFATSSDQAIPCDTSQRKYCGGTWQGLTEHLDYIQKLGFDAVWISPVVKNIMDPTEYGESYHGYWMQDLNNLNPKFGDAQNLKNLSQALHKRGMFLMLDVVVNHFASLEKKPNNPSSVDYSKLSPFNSPSYYHKPCPITDPDNQTNVEQCSLGDDTLPLPDVNTEDPSVVDTLNKWIKSLVNEYEADGVRIDTVKHVRKDFWPGFAQSAGVFTLGEVLSGEVDYVSNYSDVLDAFLDYPTYFKLVDAFSSTSGNLSELVEMAKATQAKYKNGAFMVGSFLENHDQPRFPSFTKDMALIKNAMAWTFAGDCIPIMYYGQEQEYEGGAEPSNREALWLSGYQTEKPLVAHARALNAARRVAMDYNKDFLKTPMRFIDQPCNASLMLFKPPITTLLTNMGNDYYNSTVRAFWTLPGSNGSNGSTNAGARGLYGAGEVLVDVFTCQSMVTGEEDGGLVLRAKYGMPQMLLPARALSKDGELCPGSAIEQGGKGGPLGASSGERGRELHFWPMLALSFLFLFL